MPIAVVFWGDDELAQLVRENHHLFSGPPVFTPDPPEREETRYDRYLQYIDSIKDLFNEFGDGWGGDDTPRRMAMKMYPYEEWDGV